MPRRCHIATWALFAVPYWRGDGGEWSPLLRQTSRKEAWMMADQQENLTLAERLYIRKSSAA